MLSFAICDDYYFNENTKLEKIQIGSLIFF
ncbi:MAG: hypothetical protein ACI8RD_012809 [Bacillariaceae sp.]|jgi:hypothetical protein